MARLTGDAERKRWSDAAFLGAAQPAVACLLAGDAVLDADLAGIVIGDEGPVRDLWSAHLIRGRVSRTNLSHALVAASCHGAEFSDVSFLGAGFDRANLSKARFTNCCFDEADLVVSCDDTIFVGCSFVRATFRGGRLGHEYGGRRARFTGCDLSDAVFRAVEWRASVFQSCAFRGARFQSCDLRGVRFPSCTTLPTIAECRQSE